MRSPDQLGRSYSAKVLPNIMANIASTKERNEAIKSRRERRPADRDGEGRAKTAPNEIVGEHGRGRKNKAPEPFWAPSWDGGKEGRSKSPPHRGSVTAGAAARPRIGKSKSVAVLDGMLKRTSLSPPRTTDGRKGAAAKPALMFAPESPKRGVSGLSHSALKAGNYKGGSELAPPFA